jgi:myxalamid-type polyketide synthase MxaE and MxaD
VLRLDPSMLDARRSLGDLGFDSLMALEFRNRLEAALRVKLAATLIWRYPTFSALAQHLEDKLGMTESPLDTTTPEPAADDGLDAVADQIAGLADEEVEALLKRKLAHLSEASE